MECFCSLLVLAAAAGIGVWFFRRKRNKLTVASSARPRWDDKSARDRDEAARAERTVVPADIDRAEAAIDTFAKALGNTDALYRAFAAISRAGGAGTFDETIHRAFNDPGLLDRPWWWLGAVAELAERDGRSGVAAKIAAFTEVFVVLYLPKLNLAGSMDAGLSRPPAAARARIGAVGLAALARFGLNQTILGNHIGHTLNDGASFDLRAGAVELHLATTLLDLDRSGTAVSAPALERARAVLSAPRQGQTSDTAAPLSEAEIISLANDGHHAEAIDLGVRHLADCQQALGPEDARTLRAAAALSTAYARAARYYDVVAVVDNLYPVAVRVLGEDDASTSLMAFNLAMALRETGRADRALTLLEAAVAQALSNRDPDNKTTLTMQSELALTYTALGDHAKALPLHEHVAAARAGTLGPLDRATLFSRLFLAFAHVEASNIDRAIVEFESVLPSCRHVFGVDHPETLSAQHRLAGAYRDAGRRDDAIALYEQTLQAWRRTLGERDARTLQTMSMLSVTLLESDPERSLAIMDEAAALAREALPPNDPVAKDIQASLMMVRIMATPSPPVDAQPTPRPPRNGPQHPLQRQTVFENSGKGLGFGHAWSPDGDLIAVAGYDNAVVVIDVESGAEVLRTARLGTVTCVSWSPDGRTFACGTSQRSVHLIDARRAQELHRTAGHEDEIRSIAYSPDGRLIATCANDGRLCLWRAGDLSPVTTIHAHRGLARSVAWAPDSATVATGGEDAAVRIWRASDGSELGGHTEHTRGICGLALSPDGQLVASGSLDGTARVWNLGTQCLDQAIDADGWWVVDVAFAPEPRLLAILSQEEILIWDLVARQFFGVARKPFGADSISWRPGRRQIVTVGHDVSLWDVAT